MSVDIGGLVAIILFYLAILLVGIWAAWKNKNKPHHGELLRNEVIMIGRRDIGLLLGIFTMTATWVGGAYINGTAEAVYVVGLGFIWTQAPIGYAVSLIIGGLFFAKTMRSRRYVTMLDPFQETYGGGIGSLMFIPAVMGELFWSAAVLSALGSSLSVIFEINVELAIIISTVIAVGYTLIGGLYSVVYTDMAQLFCIFVGLYISLPFAVLNPAVTSITITATKYVYREPWIGTISPGNAWIWVDNYFLMATDNELVWIMRAAVVIFGLLAAGMTWMSNSVYGLWYLSSDLIFVLLFPQLLSVLYLKGTNAYGCITSYIFGLFLRVGGGEPYLRLQPFICYAGCYLDITFPTGPIYLQKFPFKTVSMLASLMMNLFVSHLTKYLFNRGMFPPRLDILKGFVSQPQKEKSNKVAAETKDSTDAVEQTPTDKEGVDPLNTTSEDKEPVDG
ncbi:high-affinity choline transporter 1-like isoform X3 [Scyliorhinus canicula]|uniref:high-affinity choline transporter 1-like isoform X3 n=1 Tax=Scyliorhinus canicula TaxID=7830 RepID=UPI0018F75032|nr:high-affinity choline transporter 1-like isoform X3 [Scyliorhinus canicula]